MKSQIKVLLFACVLAVVAGCGALLPKPQTARQGVAEGYASVTILATAAASYGELKAVCTKPLTVLPCKDPGVVEKLKGATAKAYDAVQAADRAVFDPNWQGDPPQKVLAFAQQALQLLTALMAESQFQATAPDAAKTAPTRAAAHITNVKG